METLAQRLKAYRSAPLITGEPRKLTQQETADRLRISLRHYVDLEHGQAMPREKDTIHVLTKLLDISEEELYELLPSERRPRATRTPPSQILLMLPELANSRFWSSVALETINATSVVEGRELRCTISPLCHQDSGSAWLAFLKYARRYRRYVAGCLIAPPANLSRDDQVLIAELRAQVTELSADGMPIVALDRRFPWDNPQLAPLPAAGHADKESPPANEESATEQDGRTPPPLPEIVHLANSDRTIGKDCAEAVVDAFRRAGMHTPRVATIVDDLKLTPASDRLAGIVQGLGEDLSATMIKAFCRFGYGSDQPDAPNYWGTAEEIANVLASDPDAIIAATSSTAEQVAAMLKERPKPWPALVALDCAGLDSGGKIRGIEMPLAYATYDPRRLAERALRCLEKLIHGQPISASELDLEVKIANKLAIRDSAKEIASVHRRDHH